MLWVFGVPDDPGLDPFVPGGKGVIVVESRGGIQCNVFVVARRCPVRSSARRWPGGDPSAYGGPDPGQWRKALAG